MKYRIGIDALSIVNYGGLTHLTEIINHFQKEKHPLIENITVFSSDETLNKLPKKSFLIKKSYSLLNKGKFCRIIFQTFFFDKKLEKSIDILLSLAGDYTGKFKPCVGISQNMLLYETNFFHPIIDIVEKLRFYFNFKRQQICFKNAEGVIFLSKYSEKKIKSCLSILPKKKQIINHGISKMFVNRQINKHDFKNINTYNLKKPFKLVYVSSVHIYKNQCNVIKAVSKLRGLGYPITISIVGKIIYRPYGKKMLDEIEKQDSEREFIEYISNIPYKEMPHKYLQYDGVVFASSCENMPNILIEAMGSGKPIVCSNKGPMPEFLKDGGYYFDPNSVESIITSIKEMLKSNPKNFILAKQNHIELKKFSWEETSLKTFNFLTNILKKNV